MTLGEHTPLVCQLLILVLDTLLRRPSAVISVFMVHLQDDLDHCPG
jgi:hypothetical protein